MILSELIERLQALIDEGVASGEEPVMYAQQYRWPLQFGVVGPVVYCEQDSAIAEAEEYRRSAESASTHEEAQKIYEEADAERARLRASRSPIVYLAECDSSWYEGQERSPYAPRGAWPD